MPLIYAFVARGPTVLAEHTSHSGNFATVAAEVRPVSSFRLVGERLGATRRATTRLEAFPTRATRSDRRARPENASRLEGVDSSVSRTTATFAEGAAPTARRGRRRRQTALRECFFCHRF